MSAARRHILALLRLILLSGGPAMPAVALVCLFFAAACLTQDVTIDAPDIRTRPVIIRVVPDSADAAALQPLGWSDGIPGVNVVITRRDSARTLVDSGRTDATGRLSTQPLVSGLYNLSLLRVLTDSERATLGAGTDIEGFARETEMTLGDVESANVATFSSTRGSLLTSEWFFASGYYGQYPYETGGFWELYNNADTTIYLDVLLLGDAFSQNIEYRPRSCAQAASEFLPPDGMWIGQFNRFPGGGTEHPIQPGQVVVVATDAIDHRPLFQNALDLRGADFEFTGEGDVDNPDAPNLTWLGPQRSQYGHGENFGSTKGVPVIIAPLAVQALPRTVAVAGDEYWKIPRSAIVSVSAHRFFNTFGHAPCAAMVNPDIHRDTHIAGRGPDPFLVSAERRVLHTRSDGRKVLLNTRSSRTDFVDGERTPGVIP